MNRALLLAVFFAAGCSASPLNESDMAAYDDADEATDSALSEADFLDLELRIDVLPTVSEGDSLMAQSFWLDPADSWNNMDLNLKPTVTIVGSVIGFSANPYGVQPNVPGSADVPVVGEVTLFQPDTIVSSTVETDEDGSFTFSLPAGEGYRLAALPTEPPELPFYIESDIQVDANEDLSEIRLEYADPIFGTVSNSTGEAIGCTVRLIDAATGVEGVHTETDATGFYMLRAEPGDYIVQIEPATGVTLPTIQQPVSFEPDMGGVNLDFDVGEISPVLIRGIPLNANGQTMSDATVRMTSTSLAETSGTMVVETETDQSGLFLAYALPGDWILEIIPPAEDEVSSPYMASYTVDADLNLGNIELSGLVELQRTIVNADGNPAANVLVTFREKDFNRATYSAYTNSDGFLNTMVPDAALNVTLTPTQSADIRSAVTRRELLNPGGPAVDDEGVWSMAEGVEVGGQIRRPGADEGISLVEVYDTNGVFYGSTITDSAGNFSFRIAPE